MKQKKWMLLLIAAVVTAGIWGISNRRTGNGEPQKIAERCHADQTLMDAVLESPERLDGAGLTAEIAEERGAVSSAPVCTLPVGRERVLLSDMQKPPAPQPLKKPMAADSLHFRQEYASLRTDAVRNPNSPENRAGVVSLMKARQRRLGQQ